MANAQTLMQNTSGTMIEFTLLHSAGKTVSGATPIISYISPGDSSLQILNNPQIVELPINQASGHYLVRPTQNMVDAPGTLIIYASGVGRALGQTGLVQSDLSTTYVDVIGAVVPELRTFVSGTQHFGSSVLASPLSHTYFQSGFIP